LIKQPEKWNMNLKQEELKMRQIRLAGLLIGITVLLFSIGCDKNPASVADNAEEEAIRQVIEENEDYITAAGLNDDGAQPMVYEYGDMGKISEMITPLRFGRKGQFRLENISIEYPEPNLAVATIMHSFNGSCYILAEDTTDTNTVGKLYRKGMENKITRRVVLRKQQQAGNRHRNWRMRRISGSLTESRQTTLDFEWIKIQTADGQEWIFEDPLDIIADLDSIPTFSHRDSVKIFVKINNSSPYSEMPGEEVMLRYRNDRGMHRARKEFNDEGLYPDENAGDGIYSGWWLVGDRRGVFHVFVDAIDNGTLYDDQLPYNSKVWGFPYIVR
jgi:hypothetical protein